MVVLGLFNSSINSFVVANDLKKSFFGCSSSNDVDNSYVLEIVKAFELMNEPIIRFDYSKHYQCYLDKEK